MIRIDVESFKQCFKEKEGVVINTFHGVKGEEYTTVIAFGLLYGYVPHWNIINNNQLLIFPIFFLTVFLQDLFVDLLRREQIRADNP